MNKEKKKKYNWLFIPNSMENEGFKDIPLLYPQESIAKQVNVELFLNHDPLKKLGLKFKEDYDTEKTKGYIC